jgi:hypothetical protein
MADNDSGMPAGGKGGALPEALIEPEGAGAVGVSDVLLERTCRWDTLAGMRRRLLGGANS